MIVPMKKAFILVQEKDVKDAVSSLRKLGVMHIVHLEKPKGEDINSLHEDLSFIERAISILTLPEFYTERDLAGAKALEDWRFTARHLVDLKNRHGQLTEYSRNIYEKISQWGPWGEFDPAVVSNLVDKGVYIRFYQVPAKEVKSFPPGIIVRVVSVVRGMANCMAISRSKIEVTYKEIVLPPLGLKEMRARLSENEEAIEEIRNEIRKHSCCHGRFEAIKRAFEKELEFHEAIRGIGRAEELAYLKGYIPRDKEAPLSECAKREKWGILIADPSDEDNVPTLVRNPRWISVISPVFRLIEVVPGYHELDISLWFLLFLSVFFGMLIGDAAYGSIFLILTLFSQFKWGKKVKDKSVFTLLYIFSSCAILWGLLTGTFFGQEWLPEWVKPLAPALRDDKNVQALCFLLGAIHLSIAHLWRAVIKAPSVRALSDIGWVIILWGGFFLAKTLILGCAFPDYGKWFFITGPVLIILFTEPKKNILKGIGRGLGSFLLSAVNSFTDIVSYIRLFAVGLATVAVADSFNRMAMEIGFNSILSSLITALVLLVGHSLNIVLGPMSVLVHGVRLNVLEFCGHVDIKWSGFNYRPLKEEG